MVGYDLSDSLDKPAWLESLLTEKFFTNCFHHSDAKKNERNVFCVDCSDAICQHCLSSHVEHRLLQIRRYVYHDVIRLQDIQKLVDCGQVQPYIINSARVVFLNQRPQPRQSKGFSNSCITCERTLQDSYRYCSVACKVDAFVKQEKEISNLMPRGNLLYLTEISSNFLTENARKLVFEELSPNSILDELPSQTSSGSSASDVTGCLTTITSATKALPYLKKIRSSHPTGVISPPKTVILRYVSRRKGTPHRSPLY
ncbi:hypothetical protein O6H91_06G136900 [Diphasiastrum complanatum]|uniref:Uncharacterized protein n=1 Tax=Diphasiastrum complanatum TaxID=34168 RepID=A0ACC2DJU9_DIPCM|nr:hypothetical protein O6H91_06G136900 [Diphasiastrum complanatum]